MYISAMVMRRNIGSTGPRPAQAGGVSLRTAYDVDADESYQVRRNLPESPWHIAVRTRQGSGRVDLGPQGVHVLQAESLIVFEERELRAYGCDAERWQFWWFYFTHADALPCPTATVLPVPEIEDEADAFEMIFHSLRQEYAPARNVAAAQFLYCFHRWLARSGMGESEHPHARTVSNVIEYMHAHLDAPASVRALAKMAHLSERRFRQVFTEVAGVGPKAYHDRLRLEHARSLLRLRLINVNEAADRFGFSSPFHFSKRFKERFGVPPSQVE